MVLPEIQTTQAAPKVKRGRRPLTGAKEFLIRMRPFTQDGVEYDYFNVPRMQDYRSWYQRARNLDIRLGGHRNADGTITIWKKAEPQLNSD